MKGQGIDMKKYFFVVKRENFKTGNVFCVDVGVVEAETIEEAENEIDKEFGHNSDYQLTIKELTEKMTYFGVYQDVFM